MVRALEGKVNQNHRPDLLWSGRWYRKIYRRGLSVIDGNLVLDHIRKDEYILVKQEGPVDITSWRAQIGFDDEGKPYVIRWLTRE